MYKFIINETGKSNSGSLIYYKDENSFDYVPSRNADISLLVGYLHVGIDSETMTAQQVWGLCPFEGWDKITLNIPTFIEGELILEGDIQPGMAYRIDESEKWFVKYDSLSGWVCIGESEVMKNDTVIKFAGGTIAVISDGKLKSLWLNPKLE